MTVGIRKALAKSVRRRVYLFDNLHIFNQPIHLTYVNVWEPDKVWYAGVEQDVVGVGGPDAVVTVLAQQVVHLKPRVSPIKPECRLKGDQLKSE